MYNNSTWYGFGLGFFFLFLGIFCWMDMFDVGCSVFSAYKWIGVWGGFLGTYICVYSVSQRLESWFKENDFLTISINFGIFFRLGFFFFLGIVLRFPNQTHTINDFLWFLFYSVLALSCVKITIFFFPKSSLLFWLIDLVTKFLYRIILWTTNVSSLYRGLAPSGTQIWFSRRSHKILNIFVQFREILSFWKQ